MAAMGAPAGGERRFGNSGWIVSRRFDIAIVAVPMLAALASLLTLDERWGSALPLWAFLLVIVAFDVAHVWATIYLTYMDREVRRRRPLLLWLTLLVAFVVAYRLHLHSASLYWTLLAYVAIFHFIKQHYGFIALYKLCGGERNSIDFYLDKWTLWVGALGPVLLSHATPMRQFDWFHAGEQFIATIDPSFRPEIIGAMVLFAMLYSARQVQLWVTERRFNIGKNMWMVCAWVSWSVGLSLSDHIFVSAAFLNLLHGIPFLALVWYRCNKRHEGRRSTSSPLLSWLSQRKNWLYFYGLVLGLAIIEESLWDGAVWRVYLPSLLPFETVQPEAVALSLWVAILSVPQIAHYYLDAWIWKFDKNNPDLIEVLQEG